MALKPVLRGEVGARARRVCGRTREKVWASAGGARRRVLLSSLWCSPAGIAHRFLLETVHDAVVVGERAEVHGRLRGADGATTIERGDWGAAVAVRRLLRRAANGSRLAPLDV